MARDNARPVPWWRWCARVLLAVCALAVLIDILNPERIVIGSIYARAERHFKDGALSAIRREALSLSSGVCEIVPAGLGDSIGDIAALSIAWNGLNGAR